MSVKSRRHAAVKPVGRRQRKTLLGFCKSRLDEDRDTSSAERFVAKGLRELISERDNLKSRVTRLENVAEATTEFLLNRSVENELAVIQALKHVGVRVTIKEIKR
jgi:hypothetical protein